VSSGVALAALFFALLAGVAPAGGAVAFFFETLPLAVLDGGIVSTPARGVTARF
jgi:hypothetical protein